MVGPHAILSRPGVWGVCLLSGSSRSTQQVQLFGDSHARIKLCSDSCSRIRDKLNLLDYNDVGFGNYECTFRDTQWG